MTKWTHVRGSAFITSQEVRNLLRESAQACGIPGGLSSIQHLRTSFYAVFDVTTDLGSRFIARIGAQEDAGGVFNAEGPQGCSTVIPSGQRREFDALQALGDAGAPVLAVTGIEDRDGYEIGWMPFATSVGELSASDWAFVLEGFWRGQAETPGLLNVTKTLQRLSTLPDSERTDRLRERYHVDLDRLYVTATRFGLLHGDPHPSNALLTAEGPRLFDLETTSYGPLAWDYVYLTSALSAAGAHRIVEELTPDQFYLTTAEVTAAWRLRTISAEIRSASNLLSG